MNVRGRLGAVLIAMVAAAAVGTSVLTAAQPDVGDRKKTRWGTLSSALGSSFFTVEGVATASAGRSRYVAIAGYDDLASDSNQLRVYKYGLDGHASEVPKPPGPLSKAHKVFAAGFGSKICVGGLDLSNRFAAYCRQDNAPVRASWHTLPRLPVDGQAYDIAGSRGSLFAVVVQPNKQIAFRLVGQRWVRSNLSLSSRAGVLNASTLGGRPAVTVVKANAPRVDVRLLEANGEWRSGLTQQARRRISALGLQIVNLGSAQELGSSFVVGVSQRHAGGGFRFGVVSLESGRFFAAPLRSGAASQGAAFAGSNNTVWALWKEIRQDTRRRRLVVRVFAARLAGSDQDQWRRSLRNPQQIYAGEYQPANLAVIAQRGGWRAVVPEFTGRRISYSLVPLR